MALLAGAITTPWGGGGTNTPPGESGHVPASCTSPARGGRVISSR